MTFDPKQLKVDALVSKLSPADGAESDAVILSGYLGKSPREGFWRLYLTPALNDYVEVNEADIVHSIQTEDEHTGTVLYVKRGTALQRTQTVSQQVQAEFLSGDIMQQYLGETGVQSLTDGDVQVQSTVKCATVVSMKICPSVKKCPSYNIACVPPTPRCTTFLVC